MTRSTEVDLARARKLLADGALVLDVREREEWDAGHVAEAVHLPLMLVRSQSATFDRDRIVLAICRSGIRSGKAVNVLRREGVQAVNVTGGLLAWQAAGLPLVSGTGTAGLVE